MTRALSLTKSISMMEQWKIVILKVMIKTKHGLYKPRSAEEPKYSSHIPSLFIFPPKSGSDSVIIKITELPFGSPEDPSIVVFECDTTPSRGSTAKDDKVQKRPHDGSSSKARKKKRKG